MFKDLLAEENPEALTIDGFDAAFIGVIHRCGQPPLACYSYAKCVEVMVEAGSTHEEAMEYIDFNIVGAWVGENTPAILMEYEEF